MLCTALTLLTPPAQVSMSAIQRGAVVVWHAVLPLENSVVHKIFSQGCAPHPLSLETRFSLYHIKVLHLLANRLCAGDWCVTRCVSRHWEGEGGRGRARAAPLPRPLPLRAVLRRRCRVSGVFCV